MHRNALTPVTKANHSPLFVEEFWEKKKYRDQLKMFFSNRREKKKLESAILEANTMLLSEYSHQYNYHKAAVHYQHKAEQSFALMRVTSLADHRLSIQEQSANLYEKARVYSAMLRNVCEHIARLRHDIQVLEIKLGALK